MEASFVEYLLLYPSLYHRDIPWDRATSIVVISHVIRFILCVDNDRMVFAVKRLAYLTEACVELMGPFDSGQHNDRDLDARSDFNVDEMRRIFVNSLVPEARQFFVVTKLHQLSKNDKSVMQNEILAVFIGFFLQILRCEENFYSSDRQYSYKLLLDKLTFLLTILGDTPFQCTELEDVKNILVEFETLVNEAGCLVYSCVFVSCELLRNKNFDEGIEALLEKIETFSEITVKEHCLKLAELPNLTSSRSDPFSFLFVVDSLLEDVKGLMSGFGADIDDVKDKIVKELTFVLAFLKDNELLRLTQTDELKESLIQFLDVTREAEYLISSHGGGQIPTWYLKLRLPVVVQKIEFYATRFRGINKIPDIKSLNITNNFIGDVPFQAMRNPEVEVESIMVGFEDIREKILYDLLGESKELQIISIVGMSGIGKTTLANDLYNARQTREYFYNLGWCFVSQTYNKRKVFQDILMSLASGLDKYDIVQMRDDILGQKIYQTLFRTRYLIVIDDVWSSSVWDDLRRFMPDDRNGSRILLTSRAKDSVLSKCIFHEPTLLSESQCCDLLMKKVFIKELCPPELFGIVQRIASRCHGLPLAVAVVAGTFLDLPRNENLWKKVEKDIDSRISKDPSMNILEHSYDYLPDHLKPCFLTLGFVNYEIPMRMVIPMWIAEGFVRKQEGKSLGEIAGEYLSGLVKRSLLMIAKTGFDGRIKTYRIHDLLRQMCQTRAEKAMFLHPLDEFSAVYTKHSRLAVTSCCNVSALHCRALITCPLSQDRCALMPLLRVVITYADSADIMPLAVEEDLQQQSRLRETLAFRSGVHVRYLSLYDGDAPREICKLVNLEYLEIYGMLRLPLTVLKMRALRSITAETIVFEKECDDFSLSDRAQITSNISSLSDLAIDDNEDEEILKCVPHLYKLSCSCEEPMSPDLSRLTKLEELSMAFTSDSGLWTEKKLNFPSTIKKLVLTGHDFLREQISIIGILPDLQVLKLNYCSFGGEEWKIRHDEFVELKFLKLVCVTNLKQWTIVSKPFPKLKCLMLELVDGQLEIPSEFGDISALERIEVLNCGSKINGSVSRIRKESLEYGNDSPKTIIKRNKIDQEEYRDDDDDDDEDECEYEEEDEGEKEDSDEEYIRPRIRINSILQPGKVADVLLWRTPRESAQILFLNVFFWYYIQIEKYSFATLLCYMCAMSMLMQFVVSRISESRWKRSQRRLRRVFFRYSTFRSVALTLHRSLNYLLSKMIHVATGNNHKLFLLTIISLWIISITGPRIGGLNLLCFGIKKFYEKFEVVYKQYFKTAPAPERPENISELQGGV